MKVKHFVIAAGLGLGLSLVLLWALSGAAIPINAAPAPRVLSDVTPIHYVAITGTDSSDCSTPAGACRTVQYAVDRAGEGDEVRVATGVYTGVNARAGVTQVVYISKTVTVRGGYTTTNWSVSNPISHPTTLDAQGQGRVLYIVGYISPTLEGLRITGGRAVGLPGGGGGGVYVVNAMVSVSGNQVLSNTALDGGGLFLSYSIATISDNVVSLNDASEYHGGSGSGGGLYILHSDVTLSNNVITSNTAHNSDLVWVGGGGLYLQASNATLEGNVVAHNVTGDNTSGGGICLVGGTITLTTNTISTNTAHNGAGIILMTGVASLEKNTIAANEAGAGGGGLQVSESDAVLSGNVIFSNTAALGGGLELWGNTFILTGNTILSNTAVLLGGGLRLVDSDARLVNNLVSDNRADLSASGLYIGDSAVNLLHNTIARNSGGDGSGIFVTEEFEYGTVVLTNTILAGHAVGITVTAGNTATLAGTLWGSDSWANLNDWGGAGTILTGTHNYWGDPAFVDPDAGDYHIGLGSTALDRGINAGTTTDIDGDPRPMGLGYDVGADEFPVALHVTKQANPNLVQDGESFVYTIRVTNTGDIDLHATITDVLPQHITPGETPSGTLILPGGLLTWTTLIPAPGGVWAETLVVSAETGYAGPLTNVVRVATVEGATGVYTATSSVVLTPTNQSPDAPSNPDPADGVMGVPLTQTLQWQGGDPDGDPVTYTVSFGVSDPPPPVSQVQTTSYDPGGLVAGTTYHWAVTASDGISSTAGPTWRFTTQHFIYLPVVLKN